MLMFGNLSQFAIDQTLLIDCQRCRPLLKETIQSVKDRCVTQVSILQTSPVAFLHGLHEHRVHPFKLTAMTHVQFWQQKCKMRILLNIMLQNFDFLFIRCRLRVLVRKSESRWGFVTHNQRENLLKVT